MASTETRICQNCKNSFVIEPDDFEFYKKMEVPAPTWCPVCRFQRRLIFWNEHNLYRKVDAHDGKEIFSVYPEQSPFKIYEHDYWLSDAWEPRDYGRDYDFTKPFFAQFKQLMLDVPWASRVIHQLTNSDYTNQAAKLKNCYLCFNADDSEHCLYGVAFYHCKECIDFYDTDRSELCYEVFSIYNSFKTFFSIEGDNNRDSWFLFNCMDCSDCFACADLRHKKYHIYNVPYTKEEYEKKLATIDLGSYQTFVKAQKKAQEFWKKYPVRAFHGVMNSDTTGSDYVYRTDNVRNCYQSVDLEDSMYVQNTARGSSECMDYTSWGQNSENMYEAIACGEDCARVKFCFDCWPACTDMEYCVDCRSSAHLFGCVGLQKKEYCVFNKQYTKEQYFALVAKIKKHMDEMPYTDEKGRIYKYGEFLPPDLSGLAYNESAAIDYYPLTKDQALERGFAWRDVSVREYRTTIDSGNLPDNIKDVTDGIMNELISCMTCRRAYRIVLAELTFLRRFKIPLPRECPDCRFQRRRAFRTPYEWHERVCDCGGIVSKNGTHKNMNTHPHANIPCEEQFESPYALTRPEIVYCESCFNSEMV